VKRLFVTFFFKYSNILLYDRTALNWTTMMMMAEIEFGSGSSKVDSTIEDGCPRNILEGIEYRWNDIC